MNTIPATAALIKSLEFHIPFDVMEQTHKLHTLHVLKTVPDIFYRTCMAPGHVTANAWVTNPTFTHVLLQLHKVLKIWMPSGGHADGNTNVHNVALREHVEETGVTDISTVMYGTGGLFDIDTHQVPLNPNKGEPPHLHYNFASLFTADDTALLPPSPEGIATHWFTLEEAAKFFPVGGGRYRCLQKIIALNNRY